MIYIGVVQAHDRVGGLPTWIPEVYVHMGSRIGLQQETLRADASRITVNRVADLGLAAGGQADFVALPAEGDRTIGYVDDGIGGVYIRFRHRKRDNERIFGNKKGWTGR